MTHRCLAVLAVLAVLALAAPAAASTEGRLRLEVLVDGAPLREHRARGTTYVEAREGREYSLRLTNLEPVRVAVALAVDGRNSIDGERTSARDARKWILEPWQSIVVSGWQVDSARARRFYFTTEDRSYASWLGDASNAGVIEAVAFRERPLPPIAYGAWGADDRAAAAESGAASGMGAAARRPSAAPKAQRSAAPSSAAPMREESRDAAATGIGRDVRHDVTRIEFDHEDAAASSVRIRYELRPGLVALGIVPPPDRPRPWDRRERASGFADGPFCPEPPGR